MKKLSDGLHKVDVKVEELKKKFETLTRESATLKLKLEKTQQTIESAEALIGKLIEEFQRWTNQVSYINLTMTYFTPFVMINKNQSGQRS